jgi:quinol monooxygenase YgiN
MVIIEEWTDQAALDEHFTSPHFHQVSRTLDRILAEPLTIRRLTLTDEL